MRFSVIVPVYKVEKYLRQCIDSVLAQTYRDFELILVDDGSPDHCPDICDEYAKLDRRVNVIHKENGGLSDARNTGIKASRGEYLLFIDSDDYWNCTHVLARINAVLEENEVEIVHFGRENLYMSRNGEIRSHQRNLSKLNGLSPDETLHRLVLDGELTISACVMAISRKMIVENNLYFLRGIKTEDLEWAVRVYLCEPRWSFLNDNFYVYRYAREGSITSSIDYKHLCDYCWILEQSIMRVEAAKESMQNPLMSYLMYHILIASALSNKIMITQKQRHEVLLRLQALGRERILRYNMNPKVRISGYVCRVTGYSMLMKLLGGYLRFRNR